MKGTPYQSIPDAARSTGLSQYQLRLMVRSGRAPHITVGTPTERSPGKYLVNVPLLLRQLEAESLAQVGAVAPLPEREKREGV